MVLDWTFLFPPGQFQMPHSNYYHYTPENCSEPLRWDTTCKYGAIGRGELCARIQCLLYNDKMVQHFQGIALKNCKEHISTQELSYNLTPPRKK